MTILIITSSAQGSASVSNRLAAQFADDLRAADPAVRIVTRDVGREPIPHLMEETVAGVRDSATGTPAQQGAHELSERLIDEVRAAELIVIASPMYNFGISSTLKSWFDHVLKPQVAFRYGANGAEGLLGGRRAIVIEARAGYYGEGGNVAADSQEPHLTTMLNFAGITDITFVRADKLAFGPDAVTASIEEAGKQLRALAAAESVAA